MLLKATTHSDWLHSQSSTICSMSNPDNSVAKSLSPHSKAVGEWSENEATILCRSLQGYLYIGYSRGIVTGSDGVSTGTWVAQLLAGYVRIGETEWVTTHGPPLSIDIYLQSTRWIGGARNRPSSKSQITISHSYG